MSVKTQGTDLYAIDPADGSLISVGCITSIDGIDTAIEQIETTCLSDTARTYVAGLGTPGTATFGINTDPKDNTHVRLLEIKQDGLTMLWAVGWSDGTSPPTVDTDDTFILPSTRSWLTFSGFINAFPFSFQGNSVVQSNVGIQVSGEVTMVPKP